MISIKDKINQNEAKRILQRINEISSPEEYPTLTKILKN